MKAKLDEELADQCKCELKVLAIKNNLAKGVLRVTVLETRTGIILDGIEIRQVEDDVYGHEGDLLVHFSNYDDFAVVSATSDDPDQQVRNFAQVVVNAVTSFANEALDHVLAVPIEAQLISVASSANSRDKEKDQ